MSICVELIEKEKSIVRDIGKVSFADRGGLEVVEEQPCARHIAERRGIVVPTRDRLATVANH